ncbi:MAG: hypothetical protein RIQ53_1797 [Pseudomonadota bacterium]
MSENQKPSDSAIPEVVAAPAQSTPRVDAATDVAAPATSEVAPSAPEATASPTETHTDAAALAPAGTAALPAAAESTDAPPADAPEAPAAGPATDGPEIDCAAELRTRFPALFAGSPKPIKLRVHVDIQQRAPGVFSKTALSAFFRRYTHTTAYLQSLLRHEQRFDLDGQPAGELSAEHRQLAEQEVQRRRALQRERSGGREAGPRGRRQEAGPRSAPGTAPEGTTGDAAAAATPADGRPARRPGGRGPGGAADRGPGRSDARQGPRADGPRRERGDARPQNRPTEAGGTPSTEAQPATAARTERPARTEPRPEGSARREGGPAGRGRPTDDRRGPGSRRGDAAGTPGRGPREGQGRPPRGDAGHEMRRPPNVSHEAAPSTGADPERQARWQLLREFERSPFTLANFCTLKGLDPAETGRQIEMARRESGQPAGGKARG